MAKKTKPDTAGKLGKKGEQAPEVARRDDGEPQNRLSQPQNRLPVETRFKSGVSGNPGGRPKSKPITAAYGKLLETVDSTDPQGQTYVHVLARRMLDQAIKGNIGAAVEITNRVEGRQGPERGEDEPPDHGITINALLMGSPELEALLEKLKKP